MKEVKKNQIFNKLTTELKVYKFHDLEVIISFQILWGLQMQIKHCSALKEILAHQDNLRDLDVKVLEGRIYPKV